MLHLRTAIDSDNLGDLHAPTDFILTYSDLIHDAKAFEDAYPGQQVVYIDRGLGDPNDKATIADVERGALTVAHLQAWYDDKASRGHQWLTYYCDRSTLGSIQAILGGRHMWRWIATLDGTVNIAGMVPFHSPDLVQILDASRLGVHVDFSLVQSPSWRPAPQAPKIGQALVHAQDAARDINQALKEMQVVTQALSQI